MSSMPRGKRAETKHRGRRNQYRSALMIFSRRKDRGGDCSFEIRSEAKMGSLIGFLLGQNGSRTKHRKNRRCDDYPSILETQLPGHLETEASSYREKEEQEGELRVQKVLWEERKGRESGEEWARYERGTGVASWKARESCICGGKKGGWELGLPWGTRKSYAQDDEKPFRATRKT